ncbi:MAG: hypothetical protein EXS47_02465 [Candidatus Zambryskibacteria bacterium]|nr:hypothetical protein [Candidatus Zambryskibacteria bacterium]
MSRTQLTWSALEYHHSPKNSDWYWAVGIIAISVAATAIIFGNIIFAFFIIISAFALSLLAAREPKTITCEINDRGIITNTSLHPFNTLQSFWVEDLAHLRDHENPHHNPKVIIKSKKAFMPFIVLPIDEIEPDEIRETLLVYLLEEEHIEPLSQKVMERLGF